MKNFSLVLALSLCPTLALGSEYCEMRPEQCVNGKPKRKKKSKSQRRPASAQFDGELSQTEQSNRDLAGSNKKNELTFTQYLMSNARHPVFRTRPALHQAAFIPIKRTVAEDSEGKTQQKISDVPVEGSTGGEAPHAVTPVPQGTPTN